MTSNFDLAVRILARVLDGYDEALVRATVASRPDGRVASKTRLIVSELELFRGKDTSTMFSDRVLILRRHLGISQESLAARLDVSFATVNRWESGKTQPQGGHRKAFECLWTVSGLGDVDCDLRAPRIRRGMKRSKVLGGG